MMAEEVEQTPHISKLPEIILRRILLTPRTENLLRYTSACARVCPEWRAIVMGSAAYALALPSRKLFLEDVPGAQGSAKKAPTERELIKQLEALKVPQLKALCRTNQRSTRGKKAVLVDRLEPLAKDRRAEVLTDLAKQLDDTPTARAPGGLVPARCPTVQQSHPGGLDAAAVAELKFAQLKAELIAHGHGYEGKIHGKKAELVVWLTKVVEGEVAGGEMLYVAGDNSGYKFNDAAAAALSAALQAMPAIPFKKLVLSDRGLGSGRLTAAGIAILAPAMQLPWGDDGLKSLDLEGCSTLGDAGARALAVALPPSLEFLDIDGTRCGDDGFEALAAKLPTLTRLRELHCVQNSLTDQSWVAFAGALPSLTALTSFWSSNRMFGGQIYDAEMGMDGARALAAALPQSQLRRMSLENCRMTEETKAVVRAAWPPSLSFMALPDGEPWLDNDDW